MSYSKEPVGWVAEPVEAGKSKHWLEILNPGFLNSDCLYPAQSSLWISSCWTYMRFNIYFHFKIWIAIGIFGLVLSSYLLYGFNLVNTEWMQHLLQENIIQHNDHGIVWVNWVLLSPFWQAVVGQVKPKFWFLLNPICSSPQQLLLGERLEGPMLQVCNSVVCFQCSFPSVTYGVFILLHLWVGDMWERNWWGSFTIRL